MMNKSTCVSVLVTAVIALMAGSSAHGQENPACSVTRQYEGNAYEVKISDGAYIAITKSEYVRLEKDIKEARQNNQRLEEIVALMEANKTEREQQIAELLQLLARQREYVEKLETVDMKCEKALRACMGSAQWSLEGGLGLTGDSDPAAMLGLGYGKFRVWGFLQEGNGGVMAGVSLPLF